MAGRGIGKFVVGLGIGIGLGVLFAPKKGSETRAELKEKVDELIEKVKSIDFGEVRESFMDKVVEIKNDIMGLEEENVLKKEKSKANAIVKKTEELAKLTNNTNSKEIKELTKELNVKSKKVLEDVVKKEKTEK